VSQCLLQDQIDELHEQLQEEQAHSDGLEDELRDALMQLDQHKAELDSLRNQNRTQVREVANLKVKGCCSGLYSPLG
jgi:chromosome segregation ATPase